MVTFRPQIDSVAGAPLRRPTIRSNIQRDNQYEVTRLVMIPTSNVTAKPRMGPEPYEYSTTPATKFVTCASNTVQKAREKPASTALRGDLPLRNSSRLRS